LQTYLEPHSYFPEWARETLLPGSAEIDKLPFVTITVDDFIADQKWIHDFSAYSHDDVSRMSRYDRYLWVVSKYPREKLAPDVESDLLWHAHQLNVISYRKWTIEHLGFHLEHNMWPQGGGVSMPISEKLESVWKSEFGVSYTDDHLFSNNNVVDGEIDVTLLEGDCY
jgi:hypothetical protein